MLEGFTTLGFVAGRTERLQLRLLVTGVTYRHPGLLARTATTLDGRPSWASAPPGTTASTVAWARRFRPPPTAERFERVDEAIQICLQLWSDDDGAHQDRRSQLEEAFCRPRPVSRPRGRALIGDGGERKTLRLVAGYPGACNLIGTPTRWPTRSTCCAATATRWAVTRRTSR